METVISIWNNFGTQLHALICHKTKHQDHCNDILQEVYIKMIENIDKVEKAANIKSYLLKMADNAVTDHYRRKANKTKSNYSEDILIADEAEKRDASLQLADCCLRPMIESLEPIYREALILTELEGLSHKEFAEKIGISYTNAKSRVQRARQKLNTVILNCCSYEFDKYGNIISGEKKSEKYCNS